VTETVDPKHLPDMLELPKARWRIFLLLGVSMAFVVAGFAMVFENDTTGLLVAGFFGVCFVVFIVAAFARSSVTLDRDGFTHQSLFAAKRYAWRDVSEFTHARVGRTRMILFNDETKTDTLFSKFTRSMTDGYNAGIPTATIGGSIDEACATMNAFRARALRRAA
jgi:hypothetical protein